MTLEDKKRKRVHHARYMREIWYPKNRKIHIQRVKDLKIRLLKKIEEYKRRAICMDCGYSGKRHPYTLDFDHNGRHKKFDIGNCLVHVLSWEKVLQEIKKCDIVCANCHRIRTLAGTRGVE